MAIETLHDVYIDQLQDLHSACKQSLDMIAQLSAAAKNAELGEALRAGHQGTSDGMGQVASLCAQHDVNPDGEFCKGMEGLVREAKSHGLDEDFSDDDVRDAIIITQYQRMMHYAIAGYGCLRAFANRLGYDQDAAVLEKCLRETEEGDARLSKIAMGKVNRNAD